jgi:hypothetical protein
VAAVLEVARQFVESHCQPKYSVIFATFDLEEMGAQVKLKSFTFEFLHKFVSKSRKNGHTVHLGRITCKMSKKVGFFFLIVIFFYF